MKTFGECPLCGLSYHKRNRKTEHHVLPRMFYSGEENCKVEVCQTCHQREFNKEYPMISVWTKQKCVNNWIKFCKSKGKNAYEIYPQLLKLTMG